jgi:5-methylcytosine-specific restriction protein B
MRMDCQNNIKIIRKVVESEEFYFQKLRDKLKEFKKYEISDEDINKLIKSIGNLKKDKKFKDKDEALFNIFIKNNRKFEEFILIIGQIIATIDKHGFNINEWNLYEDKRIIAGSSVHQDIWTKRLLEYKLKGNKENLPISIKNAILYIENPERNLTLLSIKKKKEYAQKLLNKENKEFDEDTFFQDLEEYFKDEIAKYKLKNRENYGLLITLFLYCVSEENESKKNNEKEKDMQDNTNQPLNQILYGPPGTGKTYNTINKALEIIFEKEPDEEIAKLLKNEKLTKDERKILKAKFDEYKEKGQIEFVTFHQSYGYEEFVEGIKAQTITDEETNKKMLIYDIETGIFKGLCDQAKEIKSQKYSIYNFDDKVNIWKISLGNSQNSEEDFLFDYCIQNNKILLGFGDNLEFLKCKNRQEIATKLNDQNKNSYPPTAINIFKNRMKKNDIVLVSYGNTKLRAIGKIIGDYEYIDDENLGSYVQSRSVEWLIIPEEPFPYEKILKRKFSQMTIYDIKNNVKIESLKELLTKADNKIETPKNYILIIDEINRGNISKIFGELITLIEESKRIGAKEEIKIKLPYSKKEFGVPQNLYIIGTMNTADRSIAPIDTALRRRFIFEEMAPKPKLLSENIIEDEKEIDLKELLTAMNARIEYLYDREHCIGHSYFMNVTSFKKLKSVFENKIIPLLAEYFYEDWENIDLVLNKNGMIEEKSNNKYIKSIDKTNGNKIYKINYDNFKIKNFQKIYDDNVLSAENEQSNN